MTVTQSHSGNRVHRRWFLRRGAVAAAGAAAATVVASTPAAAAPSNMQLSGANTGDGNPTTVANSNFQVTATGGLPAVKGIASNSGGSSGVFGEATSGAAVGVSALNQSGLAFSGATSAVDAVAVEAQNLADGPQLRLVSNAFVIPPATGDFLAGQLAMTGSSLWLCFQNGTGPASKWVKLSSTLVTLAAPLRVYDSRMGQPNPSGSTQGVLAFGGGARVINCQPAVPAGVPAATFLFNLALANMVGSVGSVLVWAKGATEPNASSVNWSAGQVTVTNAVTSACNASQQVQVKCTTGTSTHVILDVIGYYL